MHKHFCVPCFKKNNIHTDAGDGKRDHKPFFRCFAVLSIPTITMQPLLEEVQQVVNKAAQSVISVAKGVAQWSEEPHQIGEAQRDRSSSVGEVHMERRNSLTSNAPSEGSRSEIGTRMGRKGADDDKASQYVVTQLKNYFQKVSENKEISRLVSLLSTSINSTKKVDKGF